MGTWITDPKTGVQKWQGDQYASTPEYMTNNADGDIVRIPASSYLTDAMAPIPGGYQTGLPSYETINVGGDNYYRIGDSYYKLQSAYNTSDGDIVNPGFDFGTRYPQEYIMAMSGALPMTVTPDYNTDSIWDSPLTGAGLFLGGLGAIGALPGIAGSMFGGAEAAAGGLANTGYVDTLGGMFGGNSTAAGGLADAGYINTLGDWGAGAYNPGAVMDSGMLSSGSYNPGAVMDAATAAVNSGGGASQSLIPGFTNSQIVSGGLTALGSLLSGNAAQEGAQQSANAQLEAARIAADAAKFRPVGVTTRFGQSKFTKDAQGNVTQAGYDVAPDVRAMQDSLMGAAPGMLSQFTGSQATTAPMGTAAQRAMTLGQGYLNTDPIAQAQKYYNDQQAVMAAQRERDQANTLTGEFNRGTYGLATGGTSTGMMAANPRLEAMYNAQRQQDLQLAANATQGGMDYAKFGAGMVGTGGDLLKSMYGTQVASYDPYKTAMGGAQMLEGLGQNALDLSINMGKVASPAQSGQLLAQGMLGAAQTMQPANSYSPWGALLTGAGNTVQNMAQPQVQNPTYDPNKFRLVPFGS